MKIFEIATGFTPIPAQIGAATEIVVQNLVNNFSKKNEVILIDVRNNNRTGVDCPVSEIKMPAWLMKPSSFMSVKHKLKRIYYSINLAFTIKKIIKKESEAVFHFHNQYNMAFTYWLCSTAKKKKTGIKFAYTLHTPLWNDDLNSITQEISKKYFLEVYSMKHADLIVALNSKIKKNIQDYLDNKVNDIVIIPHGVDTDAYRPIQSGSNNKSLNFITVGSICDRKNQLESIRTLTPFLKSDNCFFYFVGANADPSYMEQINLYIKSNELSQYVSYLGEYPPGEELNKIYNMADVFISNSKSESFGLVALEALSAGLPAILSQTFLTSLDGLPSTDAVCFCNNKNDFYHYIKSFIDDKNKLEKLSLDGRQYIETFCSWKRIAELHEDSFVNCKQ